MKSVVRIAMGVVVMVIGWAYWPEAGDPVDLKSHTTDQTANSVSPTTVPKSLFVGQTSTSPPVEQSAQTCPSAEQLGTSLQQLQQQRVSLTNQLIDLHIKLGVKTPETLQILQAVGGDLEVFQFRQSAQKKFNSALFNDNIEPILIDMNSVLRVRAAIAQRDYDALLHIIQQHPKEVRYRLFASTEQSLLGRMIVKDPQIPFNVIQQFIDAGLKPLIGDFAAFTALDLPIPMIAMVQQHFDGNLQQQWQDNFRSYNLSLLAAENASAELFAYWHAQGIPLSLEPQAPNAFDLIPLPASEQQLQLQISKVRTLLAAGILPRAADVQSQWLLLLPAQEAALLSELLQQQPDFPLDKDGPDGAQLGALQQLQAEFNQLLQQLVVCPKAQQWPAGLATSRGIPKRRYLKLLKQQQQPPTKWEQMSEQDLANHKLINEFIQKKDWEKAQVLMQQLSTLTPEEANFELLMVMMLEVANPQALQRQLTHITQLTDEQIKHLSELASTEQRELFKAAGFELPYSARAVEFHKHRQAMEQQRKNTEQQSNLQ